MSDFITYIQDVTKRSDEMRQALIVPFSGGYGTPLRPQCRAATEQILKSSIKGTIFEKMGNSALMIAGICVHALQDYERRYKRQPSADLLASAHKAMENILDLSDGGTAPKIFNGMTTDTKACLQMRDLLLSLILPVYLNMITSHMVTYILGDIHQTIFFRRTHLADSNFGGLKKGDVIDTSNRGLYGQMAQIDSLGTADGSTTSFNFDTKTAYSVECPFKPKRTAIYLDHKKIGFDNGDGSLLGTGTVNGVSYGVYGTVSYIEGKVSVSIVPAPPVDAELEIHFDIDIAKDYTLIPKVKIFEQSQSLYLHKDAINADAKILDLICNQEQTLDSPIMQALCYEIAADKDRTHLDDMYFFCPKEGICKSWSKNSTLIEQQELVKRAVLDDVKPLLEKCKGAVLSGIIAGSQARNVFLSLSGSDLEIDPNYCSTAQPHFVGKLFGGIELFCDPQASDAWSCLCYAKGQEYGQSAYVAGDVVPMFTFNHQFMEGMDRRAIIVGLAYREMQPFDGARYLCKLTFTTSE